MIEELSTAGSLLNAALDRYLDACLSVQKCYLEGSLLATPPELASRVASEEHFTTELETKLRRAKAAICWSRNCSPSLVPIHRLPPELLGRIFLVATNLRSGSDRNRPEILSHVCSRWRKISHGSPSLWRYIELPFAKFIDTARVNRAALFASLAHPLLLDICLIPADCTPTTVDPKPSTDFIDAIASRIRSLEINSTSPIDLTGEYHNAVLASYVMRCKSGMLKSLIISLPISCHGARVIFLNVTMDLPDYMSRVCRVITIGNLDQVLAPLTVLRLKGAYPVWTSTAYHGLVELRLIYEGPGQGYTGVLISQDHLLGILTSSPALRIFEFSIQVVETLLDDHDFTPVLLSQLESLNITDITPTQLGAFLRLLAPGPKPLQLAIPGIPYSQDNLLPWLRDRQVESFFARSHITEIYAKNLGDTVFFRLLDLCPHLKTLAWNNYNFMFLGLNPTFPAQADSPILHTHLETLLISDCFIDTSLFPDLIRKLPSIQNLLLWKCSYDQSSCVDEVKDAVGFCPYFRTLDEDPTRNWTAFAR